MVISKPAECGEGHLTQDSTKKTFTRCNCAQTPPPSRQGGVVWVRLVFVCAIGHPYRYGVTLAQMAAFSSALLFHATRLSPVVLLLLLSYSVEANVQDSELYFMFIAPSTARFNTSASRQAVELALQQINSDGHVLPGYSLSLASGESNVSLQL